MNRESLLYIIKYIITIFRKLNIMTLVFLGFLPRSLLK